MKNRLHLYWLDKSWPRNKDCADNYNLIVDFEGKTFYTYTNPFYGYYHPEDIEVKRKADIANYVAYLRECGFCEEKA